MMSTKPARIFKHVAIDIPRPRKPEDSAIIDLEKTLVREFFQRRGGEGLDGVPSQEHRPARGLDRRPALAVVGGAGACTIRKCCPDRWRSAEPSSPTCTSRGPEGESAYFDIGITLARIFVTFSASMIAGIGIGLAMGLNRLFERSLLALIPLMLTMPTILMVFLAIMWFGYSEAGGLVAVMAVVTPFVAVNMFEGTKAMDKSLIDMAMTFKAAPLSAVCAMSTCRN